jgi:hypothetical protein
MADQGDRGIVVPFGLAADPAPEAGGLPREDRGSHLHPAVRGGDDAEMRDPLAEPAAPLLGYRQGVRHDDDEVRSLSARPVLFGDLESLGPECLPEHLSGPLGGRGLGLNQHRATVEAPAVMLPFLERNMSGNGLWQARIERDLRGAEGAGESAEERGELGWGRPVPSEHSVQRGLGRAAPQLVEEIEFGLGGIFEHDPFGAGAEEELGR